MPVRRLCSVHVDIRHRDVSVMFLWNPLLTFITHPFLRPGEGKEMEREREQARVERQREGGRKKKEGKRERQRESNRVSFFCLSPIDLYVFSALCDSAVSRTDPFKPAVRMGSFLRALFLMAVPSAGPFICYFDYERTISLRTDSRCRWYSGGLQMHPHTHTHT